MLSSALLAHGDKAILAAFVLVLTGAASSLVTGSEHEGARLELEQSLTTVREHASTRGQAVVLAAPGWSATLRAELATAPPPPAPFPAWTLERRPAFVFDVVPLPQPPEFAHAAATGVLADAGERGRVVVRFQPAAGKYLLVSQAIERRRGDGAWEPLGSLPEKTTEWVDATTEPRARYSYRVVSTAAPDEGDLALIAARRAGTFVELAPALVRRESEPSLPVETPAELFVVPLSVSIAARPDQSTAYVVMHRWDRVASKFVSTRLQVKVGDALVDGAFHSGLVVEEIADGNALRLTLRSAAGELLTEDSRRDRLPQELRGRQ